MQLVLQYENFIMHSFIDGDLSEAPLSVQKLRETLLTNDNLGYHLWRKLGDVISSISAMGYHDDIDNKPDTPFFLTQLRKTAFARIYSADKNVAIFLGRPPRVTKRFSHLQIPSSFLDPSHSTEMWGPDAKANYRAETRWSALCVSLKEEVLEIAHDKHNKAYSERIRYMLALFGFR